MEIRQTTPAEAHDVLTAHRDAVYLDVRTVEEFEAGHPAGARNVPVLVLDAATRRPRPNPDFVSAVEKVVPRAAKVLVGCQSGGRSQHAAEILLEAGWTDVTNVQGGFGGAHDASGRIVVRGWRDAGLPVETGRGR
jgi:rhodanese-related sulfurtransferase